ncbi:hypothetical protein HBB16_10230 [Pseudonocardia sp. MCCB 268]|nr:hypothetical protein [Pseudonocardia cytotoxica]
MDVGPTRLPTSHRPGNPWVWWALAVLAAAPGRNRCCCPTSAGPSPTTCSPTSSACRPWIPHATRAARMAGRARPRPGAAGGRRRDDQPVRRPGRHPHTRRRDASSTARRRSATGPEYAAATYRGGSACASPTLLARGARPA